MNFTAGIDISAWQDVKDWIAVFDQGIRFVFIKATESTSYLNPRFERDWAAAGNAGLIRGAYHFFRPAADTKLQAELFLKTIKQVERAELPSVFDLEDAGSFSRNEIIARSKTWLEIVSQELGHMPIIYSSPSFLRDYFTTTDGGPPQWAINHPLWIANYLSRPYQDGDLPALPPGWDKWVFWQYSQTGSVSGIPGNVDMNWFNGSENDLKGLAGVKADQPEQYTVAEGETLSSIGRKFGVSLDELVNANPSLLKAGMVLKIPYRKPDRPVEPVSTRPDPDISPEDRITYTVLAGDTLWSIANKYGVGVDDIIRANNIQNPDMIEVGRVLVIPKKDAPKSFLSRIFGG